MTVPVSALDSSPFLSLATHLLNQGVQIRFRVEGWSMHPTIRSGELVSVEALDPRTARRGDILLYRAGLRVFAHRVLAVERDRAEPLLRLKGDAISSDDAPVASRQVLGRVVAVMRRDRWRRLDTVWARIAGPLSAGVRGQLRAYRTDISGAAMEQSLRPTRFPDLPYGIETRGLT